MLAFNYGFVHAGVSSVYFFCLLWEKLAPLFHKMHMIRAALCDHKVKGVSKTSKHNVDTWASHTPQWL